MSRTDDLFTGVLPFFHAAEARSFRRAAERLGVTPAAVSKAVLKLEDELGAKLLQRTSRSVSLTPEGALFLARCRDAITSLEAGREVVTASRRGPHGQVHLNLPFILGRVVIPALPRLAARHPKLSFRVSMTDRPVRLVEERVDVAVRVGAREDSTLVTRRLRGSRWATVAAPAYLARHGTPASPEALAAHSCLRFVAPNGRPRDWTFAGPGGGLATVKVDGTLLIDQGEHLLAAAIAGLGLCQALDFMLAGPLAAGELVEVLAPFAAPGPEIYALAAPERSRSPNVRAVFDFLADLFRRAGA